MRLAVLAVACGLAVVARAAAADHNPYDGPAEVPAGEAPPGAAQTSADASSNQSGSNSAPSMPPKVRSNQAGMMSPERLVSKIHEIDEMEIRAGKLAVRKGTTARIRRYGDLLVRDHRQADRLVLRLARSNQIQIVTLTPAPSDQELMSKLEGSTGEEFDRVFLNGMQEGHHEAALMLEHARAEASNRQVKGFVARLLPILRQHGEIAENLEQKG